MVSLSNSIVMVVLKYFCGTFLDQRVLLVVYGVDDCEDYWLIKHSWEANWGESCYSRIYKDSKESEPGVCGLKIAVSYPIV